MSQSDPAKDDTLRIGGQDIPVQDCWLPQAELRFYPENPRIYSIVCTGEEEPTQEDIEARLADRDHVKRLVTSIRANGGLTDPLIVLGQEMVVLEGNSRLAAYRLLAKNDPVKWGKARCKVLPHNISESLIFTLLGQYHIIGRQDWVPFEQAGYLHRRHTRHGVSASEMAQEMGLPAGDVKSLMSVYSFMVEHNDLDAQHWSYYEEYLKLRNINRMRKEFPELMDAAMVQKILAGEIPRAIDIRDKVAVIAGVPGPTGKKLFKKFLDTSNSLDACYESAVTRGATDALLKKLNSFRQFVSDPDLIEQVKQLEGDRLKKCRFEIRKIMQATKSLVERTGPADGE